jgi:hypothetical protein
MQARQTNNEHLTVEEVFFPMVVLLSDTNEISPALRGMFRQVVLKVVCKLVKHVPPTVEQLVDSWGGISA